MSTLSPTMKTLLNGVPLTDVVLPCHCSNGTKACLAIDEHYTFVQCANCWRRGPSVPRSDPDADKKARALWNEDRLSDERDK